MTTGELFDVAGRTVAITGGGGVLCGGLARYLAGCRMRVAVLDLKRPAAEVVAEAITRAGGEAVAVEVNVLDRDSVRAAAETCEKALGRIDVLINGAGGNHPDATTGPDKPFFDLPISAFVNVLGLNVLGTVLPCMEFGRPMADRGEGIIVNVASMNAFKPLTRIPAYSAAKSAVKNFTEWLAVHMAHEYSPAIRVNAIAPGFMLTEQNRFLLTDPQTGELTPRGRSIIEHTPAGRFGSDEDLFGAVHWLLAPASRFVTGVCVPVDGGYSAFGGV